jgi:hypothetical protein
MSTDTSEVVTNRHPERNCFDQGAHALWDDGLPLTACPYRADTQEGKDWQSGWRLQHYNILANADKLHRWTERFGPLHPSIVQ